MTRRFQALQTPACYVHLYRAREWVSKAGLSRFSTFPEAVSADGVKDVLVVAWNGMEMLLKKVEGCLDGTLAKAPVAAINALVDIKNVRCQSQSDVSLLDTSIRRLETTRAPPKNSSFKPQKDCSPSIRS